MRNGQTIAIDFDGVLHKYSHGWQDGTIYDEPTEGAIEALKKLQDKGYKIVVFTVRQQLTEIEDFLAKRGVLVDVTNEKPRAIAYIDDRAIRFTNWKDMLNYF